ncbi:hypothetical protein [Kitasatospora sp. NPDC094016]|uniref:hypothetical protein n=1 Tax=Kitasatospora sp. NPDC094016 TaxID=3154986 RepID=UPI00331A0192
MRTDPEPATWFPAVPIRSRAVRERGRTASARQRLGGAGGLGRDHDVGESADRDEAGAEQAAPALRWDGEAGVVAHGAAVEDDGEIEQRGYIDRDTEPIAALADDYDRLVVEAMSQADSVAMIRAVRRDFEWMPT